MSGKQTLYVNEQDNKLKGWTSEEQVEKTQEDLPEAGTGNAFSV